MKKLQIITAFILIASASPCFAQQPASDGPPPREEMRENIEAMKIAFLTKKLALTPEEAQVFWPVYNQYSDKLQELRKKRRLEMKSAKMNIDEMSDKEAEQAVDNQMIFRQKELDLQKEYHAKFKAVLPVKKVAKLYEAEEQFKRVLLEKLKDREAPPRRH